MMRLLAAVIEAIFTLCGTPDIAVQQCPLSLKKWHKLIPGHIQILLGLVINTNTMAVSVTDEYIDKVQVLLNDWDPSKRFFKANGMQKLVGKLVSLEEGAPWMFKLMLHLYISLAFALKSNTKLLAKSLSDFRDLIKQITTKTILSEILDHQRHVNFAMKKAAKMGNRNHAMYFVNRTMQDELNFLADALKPDSGIKFETPIAHLIPRTPTASIIGYSLPLACGGYLITLKNWWHFTFPSNVVKRTLLHLKDNSDESFISINFLEYFTIIVNYCASLVFFASKKINDDPHPIVLCVTDNTSALNWTLHTSKKSKIEQALARFFCGFLIGSNVGVNAKWISTVKNKMAHKISRLKKPTSPDSKSSPSHDT